MTIEELNREFGSKILNLRLMCSRPIQNRYDREYEWQCKLTKVEYDLYVDALHNTFYYDGNTTKKLYFINWKRQFDNDIQEDYESAKDSFLLFNKIRYGKN